MLPIEKQIQEQLNKTERILIAIPARLNGDAIASSLAMLLFLEKLGKKTDIACESVLEAEKYSFLPAFRRINPGIKGLQKFIISLDLSSAKVENVKYITEEGKLNFVIQPKLGSFTAKDVETFSGDYLYDLIIVIGSPDLESLGKLYEENADFFYKTPIINIDHDSANEEYGQINSVELTASSCSEAIFSIMEKVDPAKIDERIATCLFAGIIIKTRNFKSSSITPQLLQSAAKLISLGAKKDEIVGELYRSRSLNLFKLWGRALARISGGDSNLLIWSALSANDFQKTGTRIEDLDEVTEELIANIPEAKIVAVFYEVAPEKTGAIIYSRKKGRLDEYLKDFKPRSIGAYQSRITVDSSLQDATGKITALLEEYIRSYLDR